MSFVMNSRRGHFLQDDEESGCIPGLGTPRSRPHSSTFSESSSNILGGCEESDKDFRHRRRPKTTGDSSQMRAALGQDANSSVASFEVTKSDDTSFQDHTLIDAPVQSLPIFTSEKEVIFIQGGIIGNEDGLMNGDILIRNGIIEEVGEGLEIPEDSEVIDASGKYVLPGGIDVSVNMGMSGDIEDGTKAALCGGTTLVMDLVVPKEDQSLTEAFEEYKINAEKESFCDYCLRIAIPRWEGKVGQELESLVEEGVIGFKAHMSDSMRLAPSEILNFLNKIKSIGAIAQVHAENGEIIAENQKRLSARNVIGPEGHLMSRPEEVEEEAVHCIISFGSEIGVPVILSGISGKEAADLISRAKDDCKFIMGEPSVASLFADGKEISNKNWGHAAGFLTSPPIREDPANISQLWNGISSGALEIVSSHHHTNSIETKRSNGGEVDYRNIRPGVNGVEERLSLLWEKVHWGELKLEDFVKITSSNAAKTFGLYPQKGRIEKGSDADITIMNPKNVRKISLKTQTSTKSDFNVFQGIKVHGVPEVVLRGGEVMVYNYVLNPEPSVGKFVPCSPFPEFLYSHVRNYDIASEAKAVERKLEREDSFVTASSNYSQPEDFGVTTPRGMGETAPVLNARLGIYQRPMSAHGIRNQQDSTFSLASTNDENAKRKSTVKISAQSGGGNSRGFW
eukprot:TRINITY_DN1145_c0_g1_i6.p1 TRINITY_DN1145_c0_g1~~TRINITY_DN1145_c0_g1_i6.p1  ORF type:complete len:681 (+),score=150.00 TRINITY_DN1145_c0_g1_i6:146-2188(+)